MSLEQANVIDAMGIDEASGRVVLVIRHEEAWDGSDRQLFLLQEKLNAYLSFALDGEMAEAYPDFTGRPMGLRIDSATPPDPRTLHLLGHVRQQIAFQDITLELGAEPASNCGAGCGCH
jgi:hypothetical protein